MLAELLLAELLLAQLPGVGACGLHPSLCSGWGDQAPDGTGQPCCAAAWPPSLRSFLCTLLELSTYGCLLYWSIQYFGLEINWEKRLLDSKVGMSQWGHRDGCSLEVPGAE